MTINRRWCVNMVYTIKYHASVKQEWGTYLYSTIDWFPRNTVKSKKKSNKDKETV